MLLSTGEAREKNEFNGTSHEKAGQFCFPPQNLWQNPSTAS